MATYAEGKRLALCDLCDKNPPAKYCQTCNGSLCKQCVDDHSQIRIFKGHTVSDLPAHDITQSQFKSGDAESGLSRCPKHLGQELDSFCKTCSCFICIDCKSSHIDHAIQLAKDDIQLYHTMCRKHIQSLLDGVHELEEYKQIIDNVFESYDDARNLVDEWESDILDHVRDKAKKLRSELKSEKQKWIQLLSNRKNEAIRIQERADEEINALNEVRKTKDCDILSLKLAASQKLLAELTDFKYKNARKPHVMKVEQLIPKGSVMTKAREDIDTVFTMSTTSSTHIMTYPKHMKPNCELNHDSTKLQHIIEIPNPMTTGYKFCRGQCDDKIMLHGVGSDVSDICVLDVNKLIIERAPHKCNINIWSMASFDDKSYVAKINGPNAMYLFDGEFQQLFVMAPKNSLKSICKLTQDQLVTVERKNEGTLVNIVTISNGKLQYDESISVDGIPWDIDVHPDGNRAYLCSGYFLYEVCLKSRCSKKYTLASCILDIEGVAVDKKYIYAARKSGTIVAIDQSNIKGTRDLLTVNGRIRDIIFDDGKLFVSTLDNRILVYY